MKARQIVGCAIAVTVTGLYLASCARSVATGLPPESRSAQKTMATAPETMALEGRYMMMPPPAAEDREKYAHLDSNPVKLVANEPVSTFSIDVDTGSYSNVRRFLKEGQLPPQDAVRIEEMINYFSYDYKAPADRKQPFRVTTQMAPAPWNKEKHLLQIGIKGFSVEKKDRPAANLVFLLDVSGSMDSPEKLGLLKYAMKELVGQLTEKDSVSMVVYAGASGIVLEPTPGNQTAKITAVLEKLTAGGSTNGGEGIQLAYATAASSFIQGGINRILLATDGDFNVGTTNFERLMDMVEEKRKSGITLSTLGFGEGNYNDNLMEQLADKGNGNYSYIDSTQEARKALVEDLTSNLMVIAKDVKIQIEFNPEQITEYRLIGYENRMLNREDFNNDKVDAGEIGAGHTVTALYEVVLKGNKGSVDPLRYGKETSGKKDSKDELAFLRLRHKQPDSETSNLTEIPLARSIMKPKLEDASEDFRFAVAVAAFGELLRGGKHSGTFTYEDVAKLAASAHTHDEYGYKAEFIGLVKTARTLDVKPLKEF